MRAPRSSTERVFLMLAAAEDTVSRLDEQLRSSPVATGWLARLDFAEAAAWAWSSNELAPLEDLVLHDAQMDVRTLGQGIGRAHGLVRARRKAQQGGWELIGPSGALWLAGRTPRAPARADQAWDDVDLPEDSDILETLEERLKPIARGTTDDARAAVSEWQAALKSVQGLAPDLLAAAFALEAWRLVAPLGREDYVGGLLTAAWLKTRRRVTSHLLGLQGAGRQLGPLPSRIAEGPMGPRLVYHLDLIRRAALIGSEELRRLNLVRQLLQQNVAGRRKGSRAGDLAALLLESPVVSAPLAAERLGMSQQAVRALIPTLGSSVRELTGRRRFQAWRV